LVAQKQADVVREVSECIEQALTHNRSQERLIVGLLAVLFLTGLGLLIFGAIAQSWTLLVPGGLVQLAIVMPIQKLLRLREDNMRLQILPQLMRLATTKESRELAAKLVLRLLEKM
jgi:hypothetical protein